jgi:hypothetical protein
MKNNRESNVELKHVQWQWKEGQGLKNNVVFIDIADHMKPRNAQPNTLDSTVCVRRSGKVMH